MSEDLREVDLQSHPFLRALQEAAALAASKSASSKVRKQAAALAALFEAVAARGGLVLLPPASLCPPAPIDERWALRHVLLPFGNATASPPTPATPGSLADQGVMLGPAPATQWQHMDGARMHIRSGCIFAGEASDDAFAAAPPADAAWAKILLEELHYDDEFRSFRVLCIDRPLCGKGGEPLPVAAASSRPVLSRPASAAAAAGSMPNFRRAESGPLRRNSREAALGSSPTSALAFSAGAPVPSVPSPSPLRVELRSLGEHRDVLSRVLGEDVATRCVFASPRLDFFFTDFALAWLGIVSRDPDSAASHLAAAAARTLSEAVATIKQGPSSSSRDKHHSSSSSAAGHTQPAAAAATAKSIASWSPFRFLELEVAIQAHIYSCLHAKIFSSTLCKTPAHRASAESLQRAFVAIDEAGGASLFDVGLDANLVGLVDPRPAIEHMKQLHTFVTPLERLACLARVENLLLSSMTRKANEERDLASAAAARAVASTRAADEKPGLNRFASSPIVTVLKGMPLTVAVPPPATPPGIAGSQGTPVTTTGTPSGIANGLVNRSRANSLQQHHRPRTASNASYSALFDPNGSPSTPFSLGAPPSSLPATPVRVGSQSTAGAAAAIAAASTSPRSPLMGPLSPGGSASGVAVASSALAASGRSTQNGLAAFSLPSGCVPIPGRSGANRAAHTSSPLYAAGSPTSSGSPSSSSNAWPMASTSPLTGSMPPPVPLKLRRATTTRAPAPPPSIVVASPASSSSGSPGHLSSHTGAAAVPLAASARSKKPSSHVPVSVSADDLLPLLVFVLLESRPQMVHASIAYMRHFSPSPSVLTPGIHSELHYRLANFEAAVSYVESGKLLQHIKEQREQAGAMAAAAAGKKREHNHHQKANNISAQSTRTLNLLLTPASSSGRRVDPSSTKNGESDAALSSISVSSRRSSSVDADSSLPEFTRPRSGYHFMCSPDSLTHATGGDFSSSSAAAAAALSTPDDEVDQAEAEMFGDADSHGEDGEGNDVLVAIHGGSGGAVMNECASVAEEEEPDMFARAAEAASDRLLHRRAVAPPSSGSGDGGGDGAHSSGSTSRARVSESLFGASIPDPDALLGNAAPSALPAFLLATDSPSTKSTGSNVRSPVFPSPSPSPPPAAAAAQVTATAEGGAALPLGNAPEPTTLPVTGSDSQTTVSAPQVAAEEPAADASAVLVLSNRASTSTPSAPAASSADSAAFLALAPPLVSSPSVQAASLVPLRSEVVDGADPLGAIQRSSKRATK